MRMVQVGHIEKAAANILVPLMASDSILVEGSIVPRYQAQLCNSLMPLETKVVVEEKKRKDQIYKLVDERFGKKGELQALEPPKEVIKTQLFLHQKQG
ncbi:hypothetical protein TorRG33x02_276090 [Trema orientale]|uniref:Uncharacterized protein n=1 Tax=Trema orientale TaxID=63057 RepID=A0A2P5CR44_TREOI|nr:hypothetical protein TorRG33x02_276090 [Trema orientale]